MVQKNSLKYFIVYNNDDASSVKWGHLAHLETNSINTIFSIKILWNHLANFELGSVTTIKKTKIRTKCL